MKIQLALEKVQPPHEVDAHSSHLQEILASLQEHGWTGRPLLVEELPDGNYRAWTGSHRIAAAKKLRLSTVPCLLINTAKMEKAGRKRCTLGEGAPWYGGDCSWWDDFSYKLLRKVKDGPASRLMMLELESNRAFAHSS